MDADFWHQRWSENNIGFHQNQPNPLLVQYFYSLGLQPGARVFIPLCGKTLDIGWLLDQGFRVVGAELSELAIQQLFSELGVEPEVLELEGHRHYRCESLDIFVGDIFELNAEWVGEVDAVYDRAALVALPASMRESYTQQLMSLTGQAPQLVICYDYTQSQMDGPPFAVSDKELQQLYAMHYQTQKLGSFRVESPKRPGFIAQENVWLLSQRP